MTRLSSFLTCSFFSYFLIFLLLSALFSVLSSLCALASLLLLPVVSPFTCSFIPLFFFFYFRLPFTFFSYLLTVQSPLFPKFASPFLVSLLVVSLSICTSFLFPLYLVPLFPSCLSFFSFISAFIFFFFVPIASIHCHRSLSSSSPLSSLCHLFILLTRLKEGKRGEGESGEGKRREG